jgi:LacI family transcriptional regulator
MNLTRNKTIGLFVRADLSVKRELLRSVAREAHILGNWELLLLAPVNRHVAFTVPPKIDGLLAWPDEPAEVGPLLAANAPTIFMGHLDPGTPATRITLDNHKVGRVIANGFIERGFRHYAAYYQRGTYPYSRDRLAGFRERVRGTGAEEPALFDGQAMGVEPATWQAGLESLAPWLRLLPKPCGVFCDTDQAGADLLRACQHLGIRVPDEVAVIAVGDDDLLCHLSHPPLSSVSLGARELGKRAASLLDERIKWPRKKPRTYVWDEFTLMERASSELLAVDDQAVAAALRYIREMATKGIGVEDVVKVTSLSRRMLELRFKAVTGQTPHAEIMRVKLMRAQALLAATDLPIAEVADRAGFSEPQRLCEIFARKTGISPLAWRRRSR